MINVYWLVVIIPAVFGAGMITGIILDKFYN